MPLKDRVAIVTGERRCAASAGPLPNDLPTKVRLLALVSDQSAYMTGVAMDVSGGLHIH